MCTRGPFSSEVLTVRAQDDRTLLREADAARAARRRRPSCPVWQLASPVFTALVATHAVPGPRRIKSFPGPGASATARVHGPGPVPALPPQRRGRADVRVAMCT